MSVYSLIDANLPPSPEDWIAARVHRLLSHDPALSAILANRIILTRNPEEIDYTVGTLGPTLHIAPHLSGEPVATTGHRELRPVEVVLALQWEEVEWEPVHESNHPSPTVTYAGRGYGTILSRCWFLIAHPDNRGLYETVNDEQVQTVSPGETNRGVQDLTPFRKTETGPWIFGMVMVLRFVARVDVRTGQIENIQNAG